MRMSLRAHSQISEGLWLVAETVGQTRVPAPAGVLLGALAGSPEPMARWIFTLLNARNFAGVPPSRWRDVFIEGASQDAAALYVKGYVDCSAVSSDTEGAHDSPGPADGTLLAGLVADVTAAGVLPPGGSEHATLRVPARAALHLHAALYAMVAPCAQLLAAILLQACATLGQEVRVACPSSDNPCALLLVGGRLGCVGLQQVDQASALLLSTLMDAAKYCAAIGAVRSEWDALAHSPRPTVTRAFDTLLSALDQAMGGCGDHVSPPQEPEGCDLTHVCAALGDVFRVCPDLVRTRVLLTRSGTLSPAGFSVLVAHPVRGWSRLCTVSKALRPCRARDELLKLQELTSPVGRVPPAVSQALRARNVLFAAYRLAFTPHLTLRHIEDFLGTHDPTKGLPQLPGAVVTSAVWLLSRGRAPVQDLVPRLCDADAELFLHEWAAEEAAHGADDVKPGLRAQVCPVRLLPVARTRRDWASADPATLSCATRRLHTAMRKARGTEVHGNPSDPCMQWRSLVLQKPLGKLAGLNACDRAKLRVLAAAPTMRAVDAAHPVDSPEDPFVPDVWRAMVVECFLFAKKLDVPSVAVLALVLAGRIQQWLLACQAPVEPSATSGTCSLCWDTDVHVVLPSCGLASHAVCKGCVAHQAVAAVRDALAVDEDAEGPQKASPAAAHVAATLALNGQLPCLAAHCEGVISCVHRVPSGGAAPCQQTPCKLPAAVVAEIQRRSFVPRPGRVPCAMCGHAVPGSPASGVLACALCRGLTCGACGDAVHPGFLCRHLLPCSPTELLNMVKMQPCPQCGCGTTKLQDCNHMRCVCGAHWCWTCGQTLANQRMEDHYVDVARGAVGVPGAAGAATMDHARPLCVMMEYSVHTETQRMQAALQRRLEDAEAKGNQAMANTALDALHLLHTHHRQTIHDL